MTDFNHTRRNRKPVNRRQKPNAYNNGSVPPDAERDAQPNIGKTDYLNKGGQSWNAEAPLSGERFSARIGFDFTDGHRGMAKAVKGAKKFVRTRVRFHENAETKRLAKDIPNDEPQD